jgi:hypothetical protein
MKDDEALTAERLEGAARALRRIQLRRQMETVQRELQAGKKHDPDRLRLLLREKDRLKRALMDPSLPDQEALKSPENPGSNSPTLNGPEP